MEQLVQLVQEPFVQRAVLAGLATGALLSLLGIFVVLRRMAFFSDGIAHTSLTGIAIALLLSHQPLPWAVAVGVVFAILIYMLERKTNISTDSLIGILFTSSLALGVLLMHFKRGYQADLVSFLFGNILTISNLEVAIIVPCAAAIGAFVVLNYRKYLLICLNEELARVAGVRSEFYRISLYIVLAVANILAIKMFGIILVSALLIVPVSFSKLFARSARSLLTMSLIFVEVTVLIGIALSLMYDLPTGATIVLTGTGFFATGMLITGWRKG